MPTEIDSLQIKIESQANGAAQSIDELAASLNNLKGAANVTKIKNGLGKLSETLKSFEGSNSGMQKIKELKNDLNELSSTAGNLKGLNSSLNSLKKTAVPVTNKLSTALSSLKTKYIGIIYIGQKAYSAISNSVNSINSYVENVNLFTVSMGEYADEAMEYAETVHDAMGIDVSEFIRNQGIFMSMAKGFGLATDAAYELSKGLTELSYDLASFYNISLDAVGDGAFSKVQSGIAGELEPLRRLGFALSEASLQQVAYNHGINMSVREMTEAQKATLRYTAMVEQAADMGVIGDMSRTLMTPANALRILKQQLNELTRSIGSLFIPILIKVIPYVQAFVKSLTSAAQALAKVWGFSLPTIDYSGVDNLGSSLEDATENAKELKQSMMGIDELNVVNQSSAESGTGNSLGSDLGIDIESIWDKSLFSNLQSQVDELVPKIENLWEIVKLVGAAIISWKVATDVHDFFKMFTDKNLTFAKTAGLAISLTGLTLSFSGSYDIGKGDTNVLSIVKTIIGDALAIGGALLTFGTGPVGWIIGIGAALAVTVTGVTMGMSAKFKQDVQQELEDRFGEFEMSSAEISEFVANLTTTDVSMDIDLYVEQEELVAQAKEKLTTALNNLGILNVKAKMGLEVSQESYDEAVDNLLESSNKYFEDKIISYKIAVDILLDETASGVNLSEFATDFLISNQAKLNDLGEDLKDVVSSGFVDGEWIPNKLEEAIKLQNEIQQVLSYVSDTEFKAKMKALELDTAGVEMTLSSYETIRDDASAIVSEQLSNLENIRLENLQLAQMQFDQNILEGMSEAEAKKVYNQVVSDIDKNFREQSAEIQMGAFTFNIDTVMKSFADEVALATPLVSQTVTDMLNDGFYQTSLQFAENPYDLGAAVVEEIQWQLEDEFSRIDMDKVTKEGLQQLYDALQPDIEEMSKLAESYRAAGQSVPEHISKGLTDAHTLGAMLGEVDSINYLVGQKLSTSTSYLESLQTAEYAGENIDTSIAKGLVDNLELVTDEATNTVTAIKNTITGEVVALTPELSKNLEEMGINLSQGLYNGVSGSLTKEMFLAVFGRIKEAFAETWGNITGWFDESVKPKLTMKYWSELFVGIKDGFVQSIKDALNIGVEKLNNFITWINDKLSFTIPGFTIFSGGSWETPFGDIDLPSIGWSSKDVTLLKLPHITQKFADGGFIEDGLFTMNRGEIAGKFNNGKSVVANNEQIIAGISEGVYNAVVAAMGSGNNTQGEQSINVYLDGKQIYSSIKKTESERGKQIFGNQLNYGF